MQESIGIRALVGRKAAAMNAKESRWKRERLLIVAPVSDRISFIRMSESPFDRLRRGEEDGGAVKTVRSQAEPGNEK